MKLHVGDFIQFGGSTRMYTVTGPSEMMEPETKVELPRRKSERDGKDVE